MLADSDYFLLFLINAIWTKIAITWKIKLCLCRKGFIDIIHGKRQSAKVILTIFYKYEVYVWLQLFPILCDTMDGSSPGSSVHGILQARILEWIAMPSSRRSSWPRDQTPWLLWLLNCRQVLYRWATGGAQIWRYDPKKTGNAIAWMV